jgi:hypothetical protein
MRSATAERCTHKVRSPRIERAGDDLLEGEEAVLHLMGWVGRGPGRGRFVDA